MPDVIPDPVEYLPAKHDVHCEGVDRPVAPEYIPAEHWVTFPEFTGQ